MEVNQQSNRTVIILPDERRTAYALEENISEKRKTELNKLKKKFGLRSGVGDNEMTNKNADYKDRAEIRRQTVGSDCDSFKTETASVMQ